MGPAEATTQEKKWAFELGKRIAEEGWVLLTGGRALGVMDAASYGAKSVQGLTVGILRTSEPEKISKAVDIPIITDLGNGRNNLNVLSSDGIIVCGKTSAGTLAEIALGLKAGKKIVLLNRDKLTRKFLNQIAGKNIIPVDTPEQAVYQVRKNLK